MLDIEHLNWLNGKNEHFKELISNLELIDPRVKFKLLIFVQN